MHLKFGKNILTFKFETSKAFAHQLDKQDKLKDFRKEFKLENIIYLNGNSLGALSKESEKRTKSLVEKEWGERLIRGWNEGWYDLPVKLGGYLEQLLDAENGSIIVDNTTTVNMFKLIPGILKMQSPRKKIIIDSFNFPTDFYVLQGINSLLKDNYDIVYIESKDDIEITLADVERELDENTALLFFSAVAYKSSFLHDIEQINEMAHKKGVLTLWDLSHSVGVIEHSLKKETFDFAVGCTYKYLNGGPASPAFLYIRKDLQENIENSISGWFAHEAPFNFERDFKAAESIRKFLISSPPILSSAPLEPSLRLILYAGIKNLRAKSILMTEYFIFLVDKVLKGYNFRISSPRDYRKRGSHVALRHHEGYRLSLALRDQNIIVDFRQPDFIRFAFAPLYNNFEDIYETVLSIKNIIDNKIYEKYDPTPEGVT